MKVASSFSLKNKDQNLFNIWLNSLPIKLREGQKELLWLKSSKKSSVVWTDRDGFVFY